MSSSCCSRRSPRLNAELDGRHLFAGSRTDAEPVVLDPAFSAFGAPDDTYYQGDAVELTVRADVDYDLTYGMTADREGFQELIGALRATIEGDGSDDRRAARERARPGQRGAARDRRLPERDRRRGRRRWSGSTSAMAMPSSICRRQISDIENVDLTEAITRLAQDQMVIESAMATIAQLSRLSLVDFLR